METIYSSEEQLTKLKNILSKYVRLPFSLDTIPGAVLESTLAHIRNAEVLNTYDYVDVISREAGIGWSAKSTKNTTPVTWKRAKIPNREQLINASLESDEALQILGDAIIKFCNDHAEESIEKYNLTSIGYSRLIIFPNGKVMYFERLLCTAEDPRIFIPSEFTWKWSVPKKVVKKEQLSALHGIHVPSDKKWFAWHGRGENQLHFSGDVTWWPTSAEYPHHTTFDFPTADDRIALEDFIELLDKLNVKV